MELPLLHLCYLLKVRFVQQWIALMFSVRWCQCIYYNKDPSSFFYWETFPQILRSNREKRREWFIVVRILKLQPLERKRKMTGPSELLFLTVGWRAIVRNGGRQMLLWKSSCVKRRIINNNGIVDKKLKYIF